MRKTLFGFVIFSSLAVAAMAQATSKPIRPGDRTVYRSNSARELAKAKMRSQQRALGAKARVDARRPYYTIDQIPILVDSAMISAQIILWQCSEMRRLLQAYENGDLEEALFLQGFKKADSTIRNYAQGLTQNPYLAALDRSTADAQSLRLDWRRITQLNLPAQLDQLETVALKVHERVAEFDHADGVRVVAVDHFDRPTFKSLGNAVARLSKAVRRSSKKKAGGH